MEPRVHLLTVFLLLSDSSGAVCHQSQSQPNHFHHRSPQNKQHKEQLNLLCLLHVTTGHIVMRGLFLKSHTNSLCGWHDGAVVSTVASQHAGFTFEPAGWLGACLCGGWTGYSKFPNLSKVYPACRPTCPHQPRPEVKLKMYKKKIVMAWEHAHTWEALDYMHLSSHLSFPTFFIFILSGFTAIQGPWRAQWCGIELVITLSSQFRL